MDTNIKTALVESLGPLGDHTITFGYFASREATEGISRHCHWSEFIAARREASTTSTTLQKDKLPVEVGAILAQADDDTDLVRKRAEDVLGHTWIFIDCDDGTHPGKLVEVLNELQVAYLLTESSTSLVGGNPLKWHLFLPLDKPVIYQSATGGVDAATMLAANKAWWSAASLAVKTALLGIGNVPATALDTTSNTFARIAYVPQMTQDCTAPVAIRAGGEVGDARCIDLGRFLTAIGHAQPSPPTMALAKEVREKVVAAATMARSEGVISLGATPGETTGTLLYKVFGYFERLGKHLGGGKYEVLCPWAENHNRGTGQTHIDNSCVIFLDGSTTGGFKCQHNGGGVIGQCETATTANVLSWARKLGVPASVLPDRLGYGTSPGASDIEAAAEAADSGVAEAAVVVETPEAAGEATPEAATEEQPAQTPNRFQLAPAASAKPPAMAAQSFEYPKEKRQIEVTNNIAAMRRDAMDALAQHPRYYVAYKQHVPTLCDLVTDSDESGALKNSLRKSTAAHLKAELCDVSDWFAVGKDGKPSSHRPDDAVCSAIIAAGAWPQVKRIKGIVSTPVFRHTGTLIQNPGHDAASSIFYDPNGCRGLRRISEDPSADECAKAMTSLMTIIADFPFEEPDLAAAVWLSAIFTKLLRFAFVGNVPLFAITAGMSGSGKGKLASAACLIAAGNAETIDGSLASAEQNAEFERRLGAHIAAGDAVAIIDNIPRGTVLGGSAIEAYMTTPNFTTRRIGTSDAIRQEKSGFTDLQLWATGNGLQLSTDMARRCLVISIDDKTGNPRARKTRIADLEAHCRIHRAELLNAALALLSGFFAARRKGWAVELPPFASFEAWSIVRHAVVWCGLPDPMVATGKASSTPEDTDFAYLVTHLHSMIGDKPELIGVIASKLVKDSGSGPRAKFGDFRSFLDDKGVKFESRSLGSFIEKHKGKVGTVAGKKYKLIKASIAAGRTVQLIPV